MQRARVVCHSERGRPSDRAEEPACRQAGLAVAALLIATATVLGIGCSKSDESSAPVKPASNEVRVFRFSEFHKAPLIDGGEVTLAGLEGKVVLIDLFGTWCPPCRRSVPILVSLYHRFHAQGFEILGLAYEQPGEESQKIARLKAFREEFGIPYRLAIGPEVVWQELAKNADAQGVVPTLLLMDRQGVVRYITEGLQPGEEALLSQNIEKLLAEPSVKPPAAP